MLKKNEKLFREIWEEEIKLEEIRLVSVFGKTIKIEAELFYEGYFHPYFYIGGYKIRGQGSIFDDGTPKTYAYARYFDNKRIDTTTNSKGEDELLRILKKQKVALKNL